MTQDDGAKALFNSSSMSGSPIKIHYVSIVMCQHENYNLNEDKISIFDDNKNYEDIFFLVLFDTLSLSYRQEILILLIIGTQTE